MDGRSTYRQKENLSVRGRREFMASSAELLWGTLFLSGAGDASNFRLHLQLNKIEVIDI